MALVDIILLSIVGAFALFGFWFGFVHTIGSLLGTIVGAFVASRYYEPLANWFMSMTGWGENTSKVIMFVLAFIVINRVVGFLFWLAEKFLQILTSLPFIRTLNRLLGLLAGAFEGMISIGLIVYFIERFPLSETIMNAIAASVVAPRAEQLASVLVPLLPETLKLLNSTVDYLGNKVTTL